MADETKHVPFNTAPMSREEREKELEKSGSGTPLAKSKPDKTPFEKQKKNAKKANKKKAVMGGGDEPT